MKQITVNLTNDSAERLAKLLKYKNAEIRVLLERHKASEANAVFLTEEDLAAIILHSGIQERLNWYE